MLRHHIYIFSLATLTIAVLYGCSPHGAGDKAEAVSADSVPPAAEVFVPLPDTMLQSATRVVYDVTVFDTAANVPLRCLGSMYADAPGVLTFRGGPLRDASFGGKVKGTPSGFEVDWSFTTTCSKVWGGGSGWTGQPLYIEWPDSCTKRFKTKGMDIPKREIMVGSLSGNVYFIDYATGTESRPAIEVGNPVKGTMSLDPSLNGNLYVGHGVPENDPFGALVIDLYSHAITHTRGKDPAAWRGWGAYDSSPLRVGQYLFRPGENGTLYKYTPSPGTLTPVATLRYRVDGMSPGIESSMSVWLNYGYIADNHGNIICVNLDTMRPVWHYALGDDTDATPVIIADDGHPYIYVGCEVDKQGEGQAAFVCLDGLNGSQVWRTAIDAVRREDDKKHFDGGYYATALPGTGDCSHLVFANVVKNTDGANGMFIAFERSTGKIAYAKSLGYYAWSSPVGFENENGKMFVVTGDCAGRLYFIDGKSGETICRQQVGSNFESSPVVVGNSLVVGSRGDKIYKITVK